MNKDSYGFNDWVMQRTLDEGMGKGALNVLAALIWMMEEYLRMAPEADRPGTLFWLQRVKDMFRLYDSRQTLGSSEGYTSKLLEEYRAFVLHQPLGAQGNS